MIAARRTLRNTDMGILRQDSNPPPSRYAWRTTARWTVCPPRGTVAQQRRIVGTTMQGQVIVLGSSAAARVDDAEWGPIPTAGPNGSQNSCLQGPSMGPCEEEASITGRFP